MSYRSTWFLRPVEENDNDDGLFDIYRKYPEFFTLRIHYGGTFIKTPLLEYEDGQIRVIDYVSMDYFSLLDIDVIAVAAGYKFSSPVMYLWLEPGEILDNGLRALQCNEHVLQFLEVAAFWKTMDVYLDGTPLWSIVRLTNRMPSTAYVMELEEGDSGFETESESGAPVIGNGLLRITWEPMKVNNIGDHIGEVEAGGNSQSGDVEKGNTSEMDGWENEEPFDMEEGPTVEVDREGNETDFGMEDGPINDLNKEDKELIYDCEDELGCRPNDDDGKRPIKNMDHQSQPNYDDETISEIMRKLKGKAVIREEDQPNLQHKEVRFTQGTTVVQEAENEEEFSELEENVESDPEAELEDVIDDNGDLRRAQIDDDILFGMQMDGFDANELESEIVNARAREQQPPEVESEEEAEDQSARRGQNLTTRGNKKTPGTYARYDADWRQHRKTNPTVEDDNDSTSSHDILDDHECESDLGSMSGSSDEDSVRGHTSRFNPVDMRNPTLKVGLVFTSKKQAKEAITWYALQNKKPLACYVNDKRRMLFKCQKPCKWAVWLSKSKRLGPNDFMIKTLSTAHHECPQKRTKLGNSNFLALAFEDVIRVMPNIKIPALQVAIKKKFSLRISEHTARRTRDKARKKIEGDHIGQFKKLWDYCHELKRTHPGSTVLINHEQGRGEDGTHRFKRIYICLRPLVEGFKIGCRRLIGLDGCHTKGMHKQQILSAVALDSNNGWWPIAWAVVEQENGETWRWFLNHLSKDLGISNEESWAFISDKQKGLESALREKWSYCEHRTCMHHLYNNFKKENTGGDLRDRLWACARAGNPIWWKKRMQQLKAIDPQAHQWVLDHAKSPRKWSKAFFPLTIKSDMLCNNLSESFNSFILEARDKPIITMLESIRKKLMERIRDRKLAMERKVGAICPRIVKIIDDNFAMADDMEVEWNGGHCFEVLAYGHQYVVDCKAKECTCRLWQLTGIPCAHAIHCLLELHQPPISVVDECYSVARFLQTYEHVLYPTSGMSFWEEIEGVALSPPACVKLAGRPKKMRKRGFGEVEKKKGKYVVSRKGSHRCGTCGELNHNKRSCPQRNVNKEQQSGQGKTSTAAKRKRGRPKKGTTPTTVSDTAPKKKSVPKKRKSNLGKRIRADIAKVNEIMASQDPGFSKGKQPVKKRPRKN